MSMTWSRCNARLLTFPRQHCKNMLGWSAVLMISVESFLNLICIWSCTGMYVTVMKQRLTSPLQSSKYRQYSSEKYKFNPTPYVNHLDWLWQHYTRTHRMQSEDRWYGLQLKCVWLSCLTPDSGQ